MKASRQRNPKVIKVPIKCRASKGGTGEQKSTRRTTQHCHREIGKCDEFFNEKYEHLSPCNAAKAMDLERPDGAQFSETTQKLPVYDIHGGKPLLPHSKIKLQLFPVNEGIRIGLEKDGFHPYLELTLRPRKKISSVLKHLVSKWGSSSAALGEPVLFPYKIQDTVSTNRRWTLNDDETSAGDVYAAIGNPEVFRLRYGWFSNEPKTSDKPFPSANDKVDLQSEVIQRDTSAPIENAYEVEKHTVLTRKYESMNETTNSITEKISNVAADLSSDGQMRVDGNHGQSLALVVDTVTNISIGGLLSESSLQAKCNNGNKEQIEKDKSPHPVDVKSDSKSFELWADCPSISIGGILSEVSLQGKIDCFGAQSTVSNPSGQPTHSISDSPQGPRPSTYDSCLSILDAEETCHGFPSQKFSSSGKDVLGFGGSCGGSSQNSGFELFKFPIPAKANRLAELPQDRARQESNTELLICSRVNNDERSLGLSGIKWTDSLGPFDLGLPVSQKLCNAESTSIGGFVK
ncbi:hypothetical protein M0R45_005392 [Rubus argutus]|uniref:TSL-kinase interacting protein 1 n=1 Tax=Rubus argutus TaxID=59490 RepID=A0AAW1YMJ5_RUBAR